MMYKTIYKISSLLERCFAYLQGKGYVASLEKEVDFLISSIGSTNIAIDIGGNTGSYTDELLKRNPNKYSYI